MNFKLEEYREFITGINENFYGRIKVCNTPKEVRDIIVESVKGYTAASSYNILYVTGDVLKIRSTCVQWELVLFELEQLLIFCSNKEGYDQEKLSPELNSVVILLSDDDNPGYAEFEGLIGHGFDSIEYFSKKRDVLLKKFYIVSEYSIDNGLIK